MKLTDSRSASEDEESVVQVYSAQGCKFCAMAKAKLRGMGVPFEEIDVSNNAEARASMSRRAGGRTSVPQIFIGGSHLGGCDDLLADIAAGTLDARLQRAGITVRPPAAAFEADDDDWSAELDISPVGGILNHHQPPAGGASGSVSEAARALQSLVLDLFDGFVLPDGSGVDFEGMRRSRAFQRYVLETGRLRRPVALEELGAMGAGERKALFINVYNSLVLHANLAVPRPYDPPTRGAFFSGATGARYDIGGLRFSLDDIEHGILRCSPPGDARSFAPDDPRRALVIPPTDFDPRIHFALNCGARSCPPIRLYSAENLDEGLALAAQAFCESEVAVYEAAGGVTLSKIFLWYGGDFAPGGAAAPDGPRALLERIAGYLTPGGATAATLRRLLAAPGPGPTVAFAEYDWALNAAAAEKA